MVWPPITMATQHPDNACVPWWRSDAFIPTQDEIEELLLLFRELPIDEYMWDWEGKYVDEAVGEKLFARAQEFFQAHPLGQDVHLTYRIPAWEGNGRKHRTARAFMNVLTLSDLADELKLPCLPVTEMFLPMTTKAEQPIQARRTFQEVADYHRSIFHDTKAQEIELLRAFNVTPLVEDTDFLFTIEDIVRPYWEELRTQGYLDTEKGQRVFLARSDPAMNSGLVPAVLSIKCALSTIHRVAHEMGFPVHPLIGTGSLPFRGSVNPTYTESFLTQYAGVSTYSIQSAFRYDYPLDDVQKALQRIREETPKRTVLTVPEKDHRALAELSEAFISHWRPTIEALADLINTLAHHVPSRRERLLHIGLFGYSRGVGAVKLPRAIKFTAVFYSLGVPPELIATGRGLKIARERGQLELLDTYYPALRDDLRHAGKYLNRENLELLAHRIPAFADIQDDVKSIEEVLGIELGPEKSRHIIHRNITSTIFHRLYGEKGRDEDLQQDIVQAAILRRSLG